MRCDPRCDRSPSEQAGAERGTASFPSRHPTDRIPSHPSHPSNHRAAPAALLLLVLAGLFAGAPAWGESLIGVGVHSWRTVDDLSHQGFGDIHRSGVSYLLSYQYNPGFLFKFEGDFEYFDKGFGGATHSALSPQAYVLVGGLIYGGVGIGTIYSKDFNNNFSSPFYIARAGLDLHLLPRFHLDVNGNYHFHAWNQLKGVSTGTVTVGASARLAL